ncbi:MAG: hypothetical protein MUO97_07370 [Dehalococcoidia bacterium]|nr:hypothetical protein [Dehalococcoidia bacterium]
MWKVSADRALYPAIAFYFSAAFFFAGQSGMVILPAWLSGILAIICFVTGFYCLIVVMYGKGKKAQQDKAIGGNIQGGKHIRLNIRIDSKDFVDMDTEHAKNFFGGLQQITKEESLIQEQQNERTNKTRKAKRKR